METTDMTSVSLKLLIDSKSNKVLFAEASKEVVDFLLTLLSMPIGTVVRLLSTDGMVGCLGKLYESVENLSDTYLQPNLDKDALLKPKAPIAGANILHLLTNNDSNDTNATREFYICSRCNRAISDVAGTTCTQCSRSYGSSSCKISTAVTYVAGEAPASTTTLASSSEGGYVKGVVTYMIMDNLEVQPMSTISSITILNKFNIKEVGALQDKVVNLGMQEGLKLLKASLESNTVLTNVFLVNKKA